MKYDDVHTYEIFTALENGATRGGAAAYANIGRTTFDEWMREKPEFLEGVRAAEEKWRLKNAQLIQKAALNDWRAAAWLLERRDPENYGKREKVEMTDATPRIREPVEIIIRNA